MFRRSISDDERALAERLKLEALASRPTFSESLDRQIRRQVRQAAAESAVPPRQQSALSLQFGWAGVAVAAVVLVTVAAAVWWHRRPLTDLGEQQLAGPSRQSPAVATTVEPEDLHALMPAGDLLAMATLCDEALDQIDRWLGPDGAERPWADLHHDASLAMEMLLDPLPLDLVAGDAPPSDETL